MTPVLARWRKSSRSAQETDCIELANVGAIRDSKNPAGAMLNVELTGLLGAIKAGRVRR